MEQIDKYFPVYSLGSYLFGSEDIFQILCAENTFTCFPNTILSKDRFKTVGSTDSYKMEIKILKL